MEYKKKIVYDKDELKKLITGYNRKIQNEVKKLSEPYNFKDISSIIKKYSTDFYDKYEIKVENLDFLFKGSSIKYLIDIKSDNIKSMRGFILDNTELVNIPYIECKNLENLDLTFANCKNAMYIYNEKMFIPNLKSGVATFYNNYKLKSIPLNINELKSLENMNFMFKNSNIEKFDIDKIILPNIVNMQEAFLNSGIEKNNITIYAPNLLIKNDIFKYDDIPKIINNKNSSGGEHRNVKNNNNNQVQEPVIIYIDGSRLDKKLSGPGGYAGLLRTKYKGKNVEKIVYGSALDTTNNQMELMALIKSLETLKKETKLIVYSDSEYLVKSINERLNKWAKNNWLNFKGEQIKNKNLWEKIYNLLQKHFIVKVQWVKAHNNLYENEVVDSIARDEAVKVKKVIELLTNGNFNNDIEIEKKLKQINQNDTELINYIKEITFIRSDNTEELALAMLKKFNEKKKAKVTLN